MAMDQAGEKFTPTGKQLSDKGTVVHLHSGVAMEGPGSTNIPEAPIIGDNVYGRGNVAGNPAWILLPNDVLFPPPPPPLDNEYYAMRNGKFEAVRFEFELYAREIRVDPPVLGKTNLQEVLEALVERNGTQARRATVRKLGS